MKVNLCAVILSYVTCRSHEYQNLLRPIVEDVDTYSSFYTLDTVEIISSGMRQVQLFLDEKMSIPRTNWWCASMCVRCGGRGSSQSSTTYTSQRRNAYRA